MIRIVAPYFVAGVVLGERCAPIVSYMRGWSSARVLAYCKSKGWRAEVMP